MELLKFIEHETPGKARLLLITCSIIALGLFYPFIWLSTCITAGVCIAVAVLSGAWRKAVALTAAVLIGTVTVLPYLLALTSGRTDEHGIRLEQDPRLCLARLLHVAIVLLPLWLLIALRGPSLIDQLRRRSRAHWAVLGSASVLLVTFIFMHVRTADVGVVYKFRVMGVFCLAALAAPGLTRIYNWNKPILILILAIQLLPLCDEWYTRSPRQWGDVIEPYYWQGGVLRHGYQSQDQLYTWIRENTPSAAIVIDTQPYVPVFAQRSSSCPDRPGGTWNECGCGTTGGFSIRMYGLSW